MWGICLLKVLFIFSLEVQRLARMALHYQNETFFFPALVFLLLSPRSCCCCCCCFFFYTFFFFPFFSFFYSILSISPLSLIISPPISRPSLRVSLQSRFPVFFNHINSASLPFLEPVRPANKPLPN